MDRGTWQSTGSQRVGQTGLSDWAHTYSCNSAFTWVFVTIVHLLTRLWTSWAPRLCFLFSCSSWCLAQAATGQHQWQLFPKGLHGLGKTSVAEAPFFFYKMGMVTMFHTDCSHKRYKDLLFIFACTKVHTMNLNPLNILFLLSAFSVLAIYFSFLTLSIFLSTVPTVHPELSKI